MWRVTRKSNSNSGKSSFWLPQAHFAAVESGRGIALSTSVFKEVTGKRLVYRPVTGTNEVLAVGIARAKNGDITPAGEKFCEIMRKVAKGAGKHVPTALSPNVAQPAKGHREGFR